MNVYHDDNHEHVQPFSEIVSTQQPSWFATPSYNLPNIDASTPIATSVGFQNHPPNTNINLVPANLKIEWLHLFKRLEQLCQIDQRPFNRLIYIPH
jgi:hypothetical protein